MTDTGRSSLLLVPTFWIWLLSGLLLLVLVSMGVVLSRMTSLKLEVSLSRSLYLKTMESQQKTFLEVHGNHQKLADKMIGIIATQEPMAFQAVQAMNLTSLQTDPVQEDYERSYDDVTGQKYGNLDDPAIAAELTGLL